MRRSAAIAGFCVPCALGVAGVAWALPGDDPIAALEPAADARVQADDAGIAVRYACPVYRTSDAGGGFAVFGGVSSYGAGLATRPQTGPDGRLSADALVALGTATQEAPGTCVTRLGDGRPGGPQSTPGTYYWQAWRICVGCAGSYEVTEVRAVTVAGMATLRMERPALFAGYPSVVTVETDGLPGGTVVSVQRRAGAVWRTLGAAAVVGDRAEPVLVPPAGASRLRAVASLGSATFASDELRVVAGPDRGRTTSALDDGAYAGAGAAAARLRVTGGGRVVRALAVRVTMVCPVVTPPGSVGGQITTRAGVAQPGLMRIAPDGRFVGAGTRGGGAVSVTGRIRAGRLTDGVARLSQGVCSGTARFTARRSGR